MTENDATLEPERKQTDESLRKERERSDQALAKAQEAIAVDAGALLDDARENADAVLSEAREKTDEELRLCVSDTGQGIPADMLDAVFERFWQARERDRRGLGLGLYISKHIVEGHGGRMWVESTVGEGSRFYFTLPGG